MSSTRIGSLPELKEAVADKPHLRFWQHISIEALGRVTSPNQLHVFHIVGLRAEFVLLHMALLRLQVSNERAVAVIVLDSNLDAVRGYDPVESTIELIKKFTKTSKPDYDKDNVKNFHGVVLMINDSGKLPANSTQRRIESWQNHQRHAVEKIMTVIHELCAKTGYQACVWHCFLGLTTTSYVLARMVQRADINIAAITINGALQMDKKGIRFTDNDQVQAVLRFAGMLGISVFFIDSTTLGCNFQSFDIDTNNLRCLDEHWPSILPLSCWINTTKSSFDEIAIYIIRLRACVDRVDGEAAVEMAKQNLTAKSTRKWADMVFKRQSYSESNCEAGNVSDHLGTLQRLCENPVNETTSALLAFVVNPEGPTSKLFAARTTINLDNSLYQSVSLDEHGKTYIIFAPSARRLRHAMFDYFETYVAAVKQRNGKPIIPESIASAWKDLCRTSSKIVQSVIKHREFKRMFTGKQRDQVYDVLEALECGPFSTICQRSLGMNR